MKQVKSIVTILLVSSLGLPLSSHALIISFVKDSALGPQLDAGDAIAIGVTQKRDNAGTKVVTWDRFSGTKWRETVELGQQESIYLIGHGCAEDKIGGVSGTEIGEKLGEVIKNVEVAGDIYVDSCWSGVTPLEKEKSYEDSPAGKIQGALKTILDEKNVKYKMNVYSTKGITFTAVNTKYPVMPVHVMKPVDCEGLDEYEQKLIKQYEINQSLSECQEKYPDHKGKKLREIGECMLSGHRGENFLEDYYQKAKDENCLLQYGVITKMLTNTNN